MMNDGRVGDTEEGATSEARIIEDRDRPSYIVDMITSIYM